MADDIPPLPDGATLDHPDNWIPPLPHGATLDTPGETTVAKTSQGNGPVAPPPSFRTEPSVASSDPTESHGLPWWMGSNTKFTRLEDQMVHGATLGLTSEVKPVSDWAAAEARSLLGYDAPSNASISDLVTGKRAPTRQTPADVYHASKQAELDKEQAEREEFGIAPEIAGGVLGLGAGSLARNPAVARTTLLGTAGEIGPAVRALGEKGWGGMPWMTKAGELAPRSEVLTTSGGTRMVPTAAGRLAPVESAAYFPSVGQAAKVGTGIGATQGFTEGNGDLSERLEDAGTGAATGLVTGGLLRGVGVPAVSALLGTGRAAGRGLSTIAGFRQGADDRIAAALARQDMSPADAAKALQDIRDAAQFGQTQLEPETTIADLGPGTQRLAYQVKAAPGEGSTQAEQFLYGRQRGQYERVNEYLRRSLQVTSGDYAKTLDRLTQEQKNLAGPAYQAAHADPTVFDVGPILEQHLQQNADLVGAPQSALQKATDYFRDPQVLRARQAAEALQDGTLEDLGRKIYPDLPERIIVEELRGDLSSDNFPAATVARQQRYQQAIGEIDGLMQDADPKRYAQLNAVRNNIERTSNIAGKTAQVNWQSTLTNTRRFDSAKQALDDMIEVADRQGERNQVRILTGLKSDLVNAADQATAKVPGDVTTSPYHKARDIYSSRAELKDALDAGRNFRGDDPEVVAQDYKNMPTTAAKRMYRIGIARQVAADLGGKKYGNDMIGYFDTPNMESVLSDIMSTNKYNQFQTLVGNKGEGAMQATKNRAFGNSNTADKLQDIKDSDVNMISRLGNNLKEKGLMGTAVSAIGDQLEKFAALKELDAKNVAAMIFETDPAKQQAILQRLSAQYGSPRVRAAAQIARSAMKSMFLTKAGILGVVYASAPARAQDALPPPSTKTAPRLLPPGYTPRQVLDEARQKIARNPGNQRAVTQRLGEYGLPSFFLDPKYDPATLLANPNGQR